MRSVHVGFTAKKVRFMTRALAVVLWNRRDMYFGKMMRAVCGRLKTALVRAIQPPMKKEILLWITVILSSDISKKIQLTKMVFYGKKKITESRQAFRYD